MAKTSPKLKQHQAVNHQHHLIINYLLLLFIFLTGGLTLVLITDHILKVAIIAALTSLYLIWGLWHHHEHNTLSKEVVLEYAGVAGIMLMIYLLVS
jgi:hypothetical protein